MTPAPEELDRLEALLAKATEGEWYVSDDDKQRITVKAPGRAGRGNAVMHMAIYKVSSFASEGLANAALVCAMKAALPALIASARSHASALAAEREAGRREGLEMAAEVAEEETPVADDGGTAGMMALFGEHIAATIRARS